MKYDKRGVSAVKNDVHQAIKNLDKGLFPNCFCKVLPDYLTGNPEYAVFMHADTAGTKTSLAYLYWKETGDKSVWKGIAQDAIVMNLDDLACAGVFEDIILSSTIGRNKNLISGEVLKEIIEGTQEFIDTYKRHNINVYLAGGETADVGDIVRTVDVGITAVGRIKRKNVIRINIQPGDVIVGLESSGLATYEDNQHSGIGSNGLTFARHEVFHKAYAEKYPESYDPAIDKDYVYAGKRKLTDTTETSGLNTGQLLLSPTRTYLPVLKDVIIGLGSEIHGIIHCSGGGQTKVLHFVDDLKIVKDNLFELPEVFKIIQNQNETDWKEMYQVFNMGHRMEIYLNEKFANEVIDISEKYNIKAKIVGHVEKSTSTDVLIKSIYGEFLYNK